jgi:hypothetical protein
MLQGVQNTMQPIVQPLEFEHPVFMEGLLPLPEAPTKFYASPEAMEEIHVYEDYTQALAAHDMKTGCSNSSGCTIGCMVFCTPWSISL